MISTLDINSSSINVRITRELPSNSSIVVPELLYGLSYIINWKIMDMLYLRLQQELNHGKHTKKLPPLYKP